MTLFKSGFGFHVDLSRVILIREPYFDDQMGRGGYFLRTGLILQLSTLAFSLEGCELPIVTKVDHCENKEGQIGASMLDDNGKTYWEDVRQLRAFEPGVQVRLRKLMGTYQWWKDYDALIEAWKAVNEFN